VQVLGKAAHELGPGVVAEAEPFLLPVALAADPDAVRDAVKHLRDTLDPDAADEAYVRALERRDITVTPVGDLYQLRGVLDPVTGESVKTVLYAMSKPDSKADERTVGQRRVDALRRLCEERLRYGVPTDHGHRPQLFITVTGRRLQQATRPGLADRAITGTHHNTDSCPGTDATNGGTGCGCGQESGGHDGCGGPAGCRYAPAVLHGFGSIGDDLLARLACEADRTEVTVDQTGHVLDVGRTHRLATLKQRIAVYTRQGGVCAAPGCRNTHLELHHLIWWCHGGHTDLDHLAGYCTRCHHLIHQHLLVVTPDGDGGWVHQDRSGRVLDDTRRDADRANRDHLHHLAHQTFDPPANTDDPDEPDHPNGPGDPDGPGDRAPDPDPSPDPGGGASAASAAERGHAAPGGGSTGPPRPLDDVDPHRLHHELKRHHRRRNRIDQHRRRLYRRHNLPDPYDGSAGRRDNDSDGDTDIFPQRE
jgi:hypothetical protein